jgi:aspartyl/asparaginyl-tRNA synthetase
MVGKVKLFIFFILVSLLFLPFAYAKSSVLEAILAFPEKFDGQEVRIEGEVIGEPLRDNQGVWINITSGLKQIGIFSADEKVIEKITYWGSYRETGDQVMIRGVFYQECPLHQKPDVHLKNLQVIKVGQKNDYPVSPQKKQLAMVLSLICLTTALIYFIKLKYGKRT